MRLARYGAVLLAMASPAAPAATIDVGPGHDLAVRLCSQCHDIGGGLKPSFLYVAPSFREIVADPATTELALRVFHRTAKEEMPNFVLSPQQIDDVVAYMLSLRER